MKTENLHKIRTQSIEISFENSGEYTGMQNKVAEVFYEKLQPQMEVIFDAMCGKDRHIAIDKLELDLGLLNSTNWEQEFTEQTITKLKNELTSVKSEENDSVNSLNDRAQETFFYYLENGMLPWNLLSDSIQELEKLLHINEKLISRIKKLFISNPKAAERLLIHFSENFTRQILNEITRDRQNARNAIFALLENANLLISGKPFATDTYRQIDTHIINSVILNVFSENENTNAIEQFFTILLTKLNANTEQQVKIREIISRLRANKIYSDLAQEKVWLKFDDPAEQKKQVAAKDENAENENVTHNDDKDKTITIESKNPVIIPEAIFITNAGLVLLHPFLQSLFEQLCFIRQNNWIDDSVQAQAVLLSEFLLRGNNQFEEFNLVLNKIMCGLAPDEIVSTNFKINEPLTSECEQLLNAVIAHWSVLRNTSIAGLRETFLQRNGKLTKVDNGWLLQVEQKSVDILLNHLPWGIGIVNLPWMKEMLYVEWN